MRFPALIEEIIRRRGGEQFIKIKKLSFGTRHRRRRRRRQRVRKLFVVPFSPLDFRLVCARHPLLSSALGLLPDRFNESQLAAATTAAACILTGTSQLLLIFARLSSAIELEPASRVEHLTAVALVAADGTVLCSRSSLSCSRKERNE